MSLTATLLTSVRRPAGVAALLAVAAGVALAATFWYTGVLDADFVARWQQGIVSVRSGPGLAVATGLALVIGATMVVMPCGFPAVFAIPGILEQEKRPAARLRLLAAFAIAAVLPLVAAGALLGALGGGLWDVFATGDERVVFAAILYSLLGLVAIGYAASEFGLLKWQGAFVRVPTPLTRADSGSARRAGLVGLTFGAGLGIACPMPTYYALLAWVALAASPWYGAVVLGAYGLGRALPPIVLGLLIVGGTARRDVSGWLVAAHDRVQTGSALLMLALGVFLIALFGGFAGTSLI